MVGLSHETASNLPLVCECLKIDGYAGDKRPVKIVWHEKTQEVLAVFDKGYYRVGFQEIDAPSAKWIMENHPSNSVYSCNKFYKG